MDLATLKNIVDIEYCECDSTIPIYTSEINTMKMRKVCGVQIKKSFADNGNELTWLEIIYSDKE